MCFDWKGFQFHIPIQLVVRIYIYIYVWNGTGSWKGKGGRGGGEIDCRMQIAAPENRTGIYFIDEKRN
jgi:hypothetical protein